jgi:hypothetical protein
MDPIASVPDGRVKVYRHSLPVRLSHWYGFFYLLYGIISRHLRSDLVPAGGELAPGHLLQEVADHARLRFPKGQSARRYNTLQKLAYFAVIFVLLPMIIATPPGLPCRQASTRSRLFCSTCSAAGNRPYAAFPQRLWPHRLRRRACGDGAGVGRLQQHALDDHRLLRDRRRQAMSRLLTRRRFLVGTTLTASALGLSGCDALVENSLERDRPVDGRRRATSFSTAPTNTRNRSTGRAGITRASIWSMPSIRRRSSPMG